MSTEEILSGVCFLIGADVYSGVRQDAMPQSSASAVFTQLAACLHSLHDAIKGEQHCQPLLTHSHSPPVQPYNCC